jgi:hypothetical protein
MSGSLLQDLNSLNSDNIIHQPNYRGGAESILAQTFLLGYPRFRMDYEAGIFYLGKQRFSLAHWAYPFLPRWMQVQGRLAKETFSIYNNSIWETLSEGDEKYHIRQICEECFGPLRINHDGDYFCRDCGLLLGESVMLPGYDSIRQSAPMTHHNYNYDCSDSCENQRSGKNVRHKHRK